MSDRENADNPAQIEGSGGASALDDATREQLRAVIAAAHPNTVPALITGDTVAEMIASVEPARAAFDEVVNKAKGSDATADTSATPPAKVPSGAPADPAGPLVDLDTLPTSEKIKRGIAQRRR